MQKRLQKKQDWMRKRKPVLKQRKNAKPISTATAQAELKRKQDEEQARLKAEADAKAKADADAKAVAAAEKARMMPNRKPVLKQRKNAKLIQRQPHRQRLNANKMKNRHD
jgi:colicin import membrane protein